MLPFESIPFSLSLIPLPLSSFILFYIGKINTRLVEEAKDLASGLLSARLLVRHDADAGGDDDVAELAGGEEADDPLLDVGGADVEAGRDHSALVEAAVELDHDLAGPVVVDDLELANVSCKSLGSLLESDSATSATGMCVHKYTRTGR